MRSRSSLSRRAALLTIIISPALLGSFKCVVVSNPTIATARIERIDPIMPRVAETVLVSGTGTGLSPLQFAWDFDDGTVAPGMQAAHAYLTPGTYRITFTVRDVNGNASRDSAQIDVIPLFPTPKMLVTDAVAGQPVVFAAPSLQANSNALWSFSDGQTALGAQAVMTFPAGGIYLASVTASNDRGEIVADQIAFHVASADD